MKKKWLHIVGLPLMGMALFLVGCSADNADTNAQEASVETEGAALAHSGTLYLKVNPEIAIDYDEDGYVTGIRGINEDGQEIAAHYPDYIGKDSSVVLGDLVALIGEAGYFVEEVEGESRSIVIELEEGSAIPGDNFLEVMAASAQIAIEEYRLDSNVEVDGETYLSLEEAKAIAFEHAGADGAQATFDDEEFDLDDGEPSYELEFVVDGVEYEYDIHAVTGDVLEFEQDGKKEKADKKAEKQAKPAAAEKANKANTSSRAKDDSGYDDSAYGQTAAPAQKPAKPKQSKPAAPKATPKPAAQKPTAPKQQSPAPKPAAKPKAPARTRHDDASDYDDSGYDDSGYDDSGYDDSDYDDSNYNDSNYDDSDYDDSDYDDSDYD